MNKYMLYIAAAALLLAAVFAAPVSADSTQKEEVLYVNLNTDGSVEDVYAVNIFTMPAGGLITDYGSYSSVKNLITTDGITQNGDEYSLNVGPGKIYYQGNMGTAALPWDISFRYYLNGNQVSAESLSNASGHVEIVMSIAQNPAVDEYFFKNFALMASMTLDAAKCQNITADGATIANVGGNKQLSFTIMPNKTSEFTISTDAVNFRMDAVSINGVRLMMDIDVDIDDTKEDFRDLEDGAVELDDGVQNLTDGVKNLSDGVWELEIGAGSL
ncbi:MAG: hypothetical protein Q4Q04_03250, partial [Methanocorpusculum sp.]|nr:hypothetical protein [Methanocorpusculum sp.]